MIDPDSASLKFYLIFATTALGAVVTAVSWYVKERRKRSALRRMLFAEICSFAAVIDRVGLVDAFASLIEDPSGPASKWASSVSAENYFSLFEANATNLGLLDPHVVSHITACYSFMKGSRDLMRVLTNWNKAGYPDKQRSTDVQDVARLVACSLDEAVQASRLLIKEEPSLASVTAGGLSLSAMEELAKRCREVAGVKSIES